MKSKEQSWELFARLSLYGLSSLNLKPSIPPADLSVWLQSTTLAQNNEADQACEEFLKTDNGPEMSMEVRHLAFFRYLYVATFVYFAWRKKTPIVPAATPQEYFLTGLTCGWYLEWNRWASSYLENHEKLPFDAWNLN